MPNINPDNHAYVEDHSCLSAIIRVTEYFRHIRKRIASLRGQGFRAVPLILTEDISGAFESIDHEVIDQILETFFSEDGDFDIRGSIRSYLKRESWVTDRTTGERLLINKTHPTKTAPQGSSLSPTLWRLFDAVFTKIYKDTITANIAHESSIVDDFMHVAYADDHLTVVLLKFPDDVCASAMSTAIDDTARLFRGILDCATRCVGCSINAAKSEVLVADPDSTCNMEAKNEFTWLGYSLRLTKDHRLMFTDTKMIARFKHTLAVARSVFQYVRSMYVRWRIYKVYIAPIIDWYLPVVAHKPRHDLAKNNAIESFQHQLLSLVTGASSKVSTAGLTNVCFEPPVAFKLKRLCARLDDYVYRDIAQLRTGGTYGVPSGTQRSLRSGIVSVSAWPGADRKDFGDNIVTLAEDFRTDKKDKILREKFRKKKNRKNGKFGGTTGGFGQNVTDSQTDGDDDTDNNSSEFNPQKIAKWVKEKNSIVQNFARMRALGIVPD